MGKDCARRSQAWPALVPSGARGLALLRVAVAKVAQRKLSQNQRAAPQQGAQVWLFLMGGGGFHPIEERQKELTEGGGVHV